MTEEVRQDEIVQQAIQALFLGSVPERDEELKSLWGQLAPVFQFLPDVHHDERVIMDAGLYRYVRFNHRVVRSFWIGAFAAWEGYRAVSESKDFPKVDLTRLRELVSAFESVIENSQSDETPLPTGVPEPGKLLDKDSDTQARVAAELSIIAVSWALLHELRHIQHQQEGTSASSFGDTREALHREEFSCDEFATGFILEKIQCYSDESGDHPALVRRKREMAIYFALFTLTLLAKDSWEASNTHPSVQDRINAVFQLMGNERDQTAQAIAYKAFVTLRELWPSAPMIMVGERST